MIHGVLKTETCQINWVDVILQHIVDGVKQDYTRQAALNTCNSDHPAKVETILWMTKDTQKAYYCSKQLNDNLDTYTSNQKKANDTVEYHATKFDYDTRMGDPWRRPRNVP